MNSTQFCYCQHIIPVFCILDVDIEPVCKRTLVVGLFKCVLF